MRGASVSEGLGEDCPATAVADDVCEMVSELDEAAVVLEGTDWESLALLVAGINWDAVLESS